MWCGSLRRRDTGFIFAPTRRCACGFTSTGFRASGILTARWCRRHCIKPEPAIYRRLFEKFGIRPEESFFIDDVQANIDGARACGMDGYCFADGDVGWLKKRLEEVTGRKLTGPQ